MSANWLQTFYRTVECVAAWKYLPMGLRLSNSSPAFKTGLKAVDFSKFLKGSVTLNQVFV
jgi:hypothetical protein